MLNWTVLGVNQVTGTIFSSLDADRVLRQMNLDEFDRMFEKTIAVSPLPKPKKATKAAPTLLDANRFRSVCTDSVFFSLFFQVFERISRMLLCVCVFQVIVCHKIKIPVDTVVKAIEEFDMKTLPLEKAEFLQRVMPVHTEVNNLISYKNNNMIIQCGAKFFLENTSKVPIERRFIILDGVADTLLPAVRAFQKGLGLAHRGGPFHGTTEPDRLLGSQTRRSHLHGQLQRQPPHHKTGETDASADRINQHSWQSYRSTAHHIRVKDVVFCFVFEHVSFLFCFFAVAAPALFLSTKVVVYFFRGSSFSTILKAGTL